MSSNTKSKRPTTRAINSDDPSNSLEVIWNAEHTKILIDNRKK